MNTQKLTLQSISLPPWEMLMHKPPNLSHKPFPILFLLHGWTGDETKMWVFTRHLQSSFIIVALRGLFPTPQGGFGWYELQEGVFPSTEVFHESLTSIASLCSELRLSSHFADANFSSLHWMGFSQGAALAFMIGLTYPQLAQSIVGFAGYLPRGSLSLCEKRPLFNNPIFVAHGIYDKTIPIARAHETVEWLTFAGAQVTYCESSTGHQVSLDCLKQAESFLKKNIKHPN